MSFLYEWQNIGFGRTEFDVETSINLHTILIVDDIAVVREALRWLLEDEAGLKVVGEAGNGREAIQYATELAPEVVILDIELPDLDGYAVARQLKALPKPPAVVFLTVHSDVVSHQRAIAAGGDGFAEKGKGWLTLIDQIHAVLNAPASE